MKPTFRSAAALMIVLGLTLSLGFPATLRAQNATPGADSLLTNQMPDKALPLYEAAVRQFPDSGRIWFAVGYARHMQKLYAEAIPAYRMADSLGVTPAVTRYNIACANALLGKTDMAFEWLDKAAAVGFNALQLIETDTDLDALRDDARFASFKEKVKIASAPCEHDPDHRQLDFWLGDWVVYNQYGAVYASDTITKDLRGCALIENFHIANSFHGYSSNFYDPQIKKWRMEWVDQTGTVVLMSGYWNGTSMKYQGEMAASTGKITGTRMTMTPKSDGSIHQLTEQSTDNGTTWTTAFDLTFRRAEKSLGQK